MGGRHGEIRSRIDCCLRLDPNWPTLFEQERTRIKNALGSFVLAVEHIGSTAVPDLPSKPSSTCWLA
ncbi:GrpB family protein [Bradyrhizobium sp. STM 3562]|uniref:GrpB family protein n=1 Tax=Bradyrhizobium sp. STM 3562 TaxID=578924 RepID=UPI00389079B7